VWAEACGDFSFLPISGEQKGSKTSSTRGFDFGGGKAARETVRTLTGLPHRTITWSMARRELVKKWVQRRSGRPPYLTAP